MATKKTSQKAKKSLEVKTSSFVGSMYSQIVGITASDVDVTLEFVYVNPRLKIHGEVVSRITLPNSTAKELAKKLKDTISKHEQKASKKN